MMSLIAGTMLAIGSSLAGSIVVKATFTLTLGLIGAWLARRSRASVRHAVLAATFAVLLALPIASLIAPPVGITIAATAQKGFAQASDARVMGNIGLHANNVSAPGLAPARLSPSVLLLWLWIAGTTFFLLPLAVGLWQVRSLRRSALPWPRGQAIVEALAVDAGIQGRIELLIHSSAPGPMTCGILHPAIVLPPDATTWEAEDLNRAVVHELEHVRRGDWVSHCLARAVCAAYWFHPLVWLAWRRFALEAERACDDAVLGRSDATGYADQLVRLAQTLKSSKSAKSPVLAMASRADLGARVGAVLDSGQPRGPAGKVSVALSCAAAAVLVLTLSPLRVVAQSADTLPLPQFRAGIGLVILDVTASDKDGRKLEGLSAKDFVITENGAPETISIFEFQKVPDMSYYVIGYYTPNLSVDDRFRKIGVTLKQDKTARLDYRAGYYAAGTSNAVARSRAVQNTMGADIKMGTDIKPPVVIYRVDPEYSEEARKAKYSGSVVLSVAVNEVGQAVEIRVIRSLGLGLDEKAAEAVSKWKFRPGTKEGKPIVMQAQVEVSFRLL